MVYNGQSRVHRKQNDKKQNKNHNTEKSRYQHYGPTKAKIIKQCYMYQLAEGNIKNLNKHVFHSKRKQKHVTR